MLTNAWLGSAHPPEQCQAMPKIISNGWPYALPNMRMVI